MTRLNAPPRRTTEQEGLKTACAITACAVDKDKQRPDSFGCVRPGRVEIVFLFRLMSQSVAIGPRACQPANDEED